MGLDQAAAKYPSLTGAGETVVVIDSGVDYKHPSLGGGWGKKVIAGQDFMGGDSDPFPDTFAHGTGTAGVIAADGFTYNNTFHRGVAPGVKLIALREENSAEVKQALQWVLDHRSAYNIVAVNMTDYAGKSPATYKAEVQKIVAAGIFIAHPSGNGGASAGMASALDPGDFSVGSVDLNGQVSSFSQRGGELDLVAPGRDIGLTYYDTATKKHIYTTSWGTSWATPAVTGTAALIKQVDPKFTPAQVMKIMQDSGTAVYDPVSKLTFKRLNVDDAIALAYQRKGTGGGSATPVTPTPSPIPSPTPKPTPAPTPSPKPPPAPVQSPYGGTPVKVSATPDTRTTIEAENFDNGGEGLAFHDAETANLGKNTYRGSAGVDIASVSSAGGGRAVTSVKAGEWLEYTISVATAGTYTLGAKIAPPAGSTSTFHIEVDGVNRTGALVISAPASGASSFQAVGKDASLTAGTHVLRFKADAASFGLLGNLDAVTVTAPPVAVDATKFAQQSGVTVTGNHIGALAQGDSVRYNGVNFGASGSTHFSALVSAPKEFAGGQINVVQASTGKVLASLTVQATAGWDAYQWHSTLMTKTTGVQDIYLTFAGTGWVGNIQSFKFW